MERCGQGVLQKFQWLIGVWSGKGVGGAGQIRNGGLTF